MRLIVAVSVPHTRHSYHRPGNERGCHKQTKPRGKQADWETELLQKSLQRRYKEGDGFASVVDHIHDLVAGQYISNSSRNKGFQFDLDDELEDDEPRKPGRRNCPYCTKLLHAGLSTMYCFKHGLPRCKKTNKRFMSIIGS